jgi:hypothetical protein
MSENVTRFPLQRALKPGASPRPAAGAAADPEGLTSNGSFNGADYAARAVPLSLELMGSPPDDARSAIPYLIETASALVSIARTAISGDFPEDVSRGVLKVREELALIAVREHDRSLMRACLNLVTALSELAEADTERREAWACVVPVDLLLVRTLLRIHTRGEGLR